MVEGSGDKKTLSANAPTLVLERKKRKRAKRLNLCGEDDTRAQFYSPSRIKVAQVVQAEKYALEDQERQDKKAKKAQQVANWKAKDKGKVERAVQRQIAKEERKSIADEKAKVAAKKRALQTTLQKEKADTKCWTDSCVY